MRARPDGAVEDGAIDDDAGSDQTHLLHVDELGGMGLLHSVQVERGFPKHFHETFTVGVVNAGVVTGMPAPSETSRATFDVRGSCTTVP